MELVFIRHGKTKGNMQSRYIGTTDEGLCKEGINELRNNKVIYPKADIVFTSPMKRCIQTAEVIYPGIEKLNIIDEFREIDFGEFEGKNYIELDGNRKYQEWIDSGGRIPFPGGEDRKKFARRCINGFNKALDICKRMYLAGILKDNSVAAFIVHGGTIMSIMEAFVESNGKNSGTDTYFKYQCSNGHGYICGFGMGTGKNKLDISSFPEFCTHWEITYKYTL